MARTLGTGQVRWLSDVGLWVVLVAFATLAGDTTPSGSLLGASAWVGATLGALGLAVLVSRQLPLVAAALPCLFAISVTGHLYSDELLLSQIVLAYLLGRRTARGQAALQLLVLLTVTGAAEITANWHVTADEGFTLASNMMAQLVLPWAAGQFARHYAELREAGWELAGRLEHQQDLVAQQVRLRERARIAADMHDSLGHELALIALRAGALQVSTAVGEVGHRRADELRQTAESATEQLHQIIGILREDDTRAPDLPTDDTLAALVQRAADSGVAVTLTKQPSEADLPEHVASTARRVTQEALTNATRHAPGAKVTVTTCIEGEELSLEITSGAPMANTGQGQQGGYGLIGLDERVRLAGGTLEGRPEGEGFTVIARLPLSPKCASPAAGATASYALAAARGRLRRGLMGTLWPPIAMVVVLVLLYLLNSRTP